jgi:hypothetical protein
VRPDPLQKFARLAVESARPFADFELRARLRPTGPDTVVEIHYRRQGSATAPDGPALLLSPAGCRLTRLAGGRPGSTLPIPAVLRTGVRYDVKLTVYGRTHRLTLDGKTVMDERLNESQESGALELIFRGEAAVQELRLMVFDNVSRAGGGGS